MNSIILVTSLEDSIWIILFIVFSISIYVWAKKQIGNELIAILITGFLVFLLFYRYPDLIWLVAIGVGIYWVFGSDLKNTIKGWAGVKK
ncbi:MAG TPA: hypothetical protein PLK55_00515 [archaeon]|jgi:hypothetical protein|nr:hypothetical protein [archaeon]